MEPRMNSKFKLLLRYQLQNVLRARWLPAYALFFFLFTCGIMRFGGGDAKATASLLNVVLLIVPAVSILYASIYWYNSESFTVLLLTQPVTRGSVYLAGWLAVSAGLGASYFVSTGAALLAFLGFSAQSLILLFCGLLLTCIFVGLGLLIAVTVNDRMKGIGLALLVWIYFSLLHDSVTFAVIAGFNDYPIEVPSMLLMAFSPVDLTRVNVLLHSDAAALMGYTGRVLQKTLSSAWGAALTATLLGAWVTVLVSAGVMSFRRKDL